MKAGFKTTEFWLTLAGSVAAVAVALQLLTPEQGDAVNSATAELVEAIAVLVGVLAPVIGPAVYTNGRSKIKAALNGTK